MEYFLLSIYWILYFVLHSLLASNYIKKLVQQHFSVLTPFYRIIYNLLALVLLFFILLFQSKMPLQIVFYPPFIVVTIGYGIVALGIILGFIAFKNYDGLEFSGLDFKQQSSETNASLNTSGLNRYVRHPLYFATLLIVWGYFLSNPTFTTLIMTSVISLYLIIGTKLEEHKLIKEFGRKYKQYIKEVPMLLPLKIK